MADDKHYVGGEWYRICDRTGFKVRDVRTKKEWTNRIVRNQSWEPRQPQDFVQGVADDQTVVDPRPRQLDMFQGPLSTNVTADCAIGAHVIPVVTNVRFLPGDMVNIMQSNGANWYTKVVNLPYGGNSLQIFPVAQCTILFDAVVINMTAVSNPVFPYGGQNGN